MPVAVLDVETQQMPTRLRVPEGYERALVLIRLHRRPVGQVMLPVNGGEIDVAVLSRALAEAAGWDKKEFKRDRVSDPEQEAAANAAFPAATVAVCTRDRTQGLRRCLEALTRLPDDGQELLVVDSCPSDEATRRLVAQYERVGYVHEPRPGLAVARNRALREARHQVVAFMDDDTIPDPGWLRGLLRNLDDPSVLCVTGLTMPLELETEPQEWFERYSPFGRGFSRVVFDRRSLNPLAAAEAGGGNMALRRSVVDLVGPFDEILGAGAPARAAEETELFARILAAGYRIVYDPEALLWHRHRRTREEVRRQLNGYGVGIYAFWTRRFFLERNLGVPKVALGWFWRHQLPALVRSLFRRPDSVPLDLILAQLGGCAAGPWIYLSSRRQLRRTGRSRQGTRP